MEIFEFEFEYYKTCNKVICSGANLKMNEDPATRFTFFRILSTYLLCLTILTFLPSHARRSISFKFRLETLTAQP